MAYASPDDVAANLGRPLSEVEIAQVTLWIGWAERAIARRLTLAALVPEDLRMVLTEAVTARLRSPEPLTRIDVSVDDGSMSKTYARSSGLIEILPEWWELLGWVDPSARKAFSITPGYDGWTGRRAPMRGPSAPQYSPPYYTPEP